MEHESHHTSSADKVHSQISDAHLSAVDTIVGAVVITTAVGTMPFRVCPVVTVTALIVGRWNWKRVGGARSLVLTHIRNRRRCESRSNTPEGYEVYHIRCMIMSGALLL